MFIPYKVDVPMPRWPIANFLLIGVTCVVSIALFGPMADWNGQAEDAGVLANFLLTPRHFRITQLVGHVLAHAGWFHLVGNMLFLWVFGNAINAKIGHWQYVILYFGIGVFEGLVWLAIGPPVPALGASGAIMGIVGAFLILYPLNDISCVLMWGYTLRSDISFSSGWLIALYAVMDVYGAMFRNHEGVGYLAHVVGFCGGAAVAVMLLKAGVVVPARGERSLLQVWGMMPETDEDEAPVATVSRSGSRGLSYGENPTWREVPRTPRKIRDDGPIPLE